MIYLEGLLLTILVVTCGISTVTDIKRGIISNKLLLLSFIAAIVVNGIYFYCFEKSFIPFFLLNYASLFIIATIFYSYKIWAAGDSKLILVVALLIPVGLYQTDRLGDLPLLNIVVFTFAAAFIFVIVDSLIIGIKQKNLFKLDFNKNTVKPFLKQYLYCFVYIEAYYFIIIKLFPNFYASNPAFILFISLALMLSIVHFNLFRLLYLLGSIVVMGVVGILVGFNQFPLPDYKSIFIIVILILVRDIATKYNYKTIATDDVRAGMILSFSAVSLFQTSRVKGLPMTTTEDLGSRITQEQADSIKNWSRSKNGKPNIVIVRKIPFAVFITIGTFLFIITRMYSR